MYISAGWTDKDFSLSLSLSLSAYEMVRAVLTERQNTISHQRALYMYTTLHVSEANVTRPLVEIGQHSAYLDRFVPHQVSAV